VLKLIWEGLTLFTSQLMRKMESPLDEALKNFEQLAEYGAEK
jgi:hypothetical protein